MTIKNFAPYIYYSGTFIGRDIALEANGKTLTGYGYTRSPNRQNRSTQEITAGWSHTIWRHPKYGALLEFVQHAYFVCNPWYGEPGPKTRVKTRYGPTFGMFCRAPRPRLNIKRRSLC